MADPPRDFYSICDPGAQVSYVSGRRAAQWVPFLMPLLRPGLALLDCGCGVGSITLDLAERVSPGAVVGLDLDESQLALARGVALQRGLTNVTFERGNVYALRFPDAAFDIALAHTLLFHLSDPLTAIKEMRRVLKKDGIIAISDDDWETITFSPEDASVRRAVDIAIRVVQHNGGDPFYSRHLRRLLLDAGFASTRGFAVAGEYYGSLEQTRRLAKFHATMLKNKEVRALVTTEGWATESELHDLAHSMLEWGERKDAFYAVLYCAAIGWNQAA